MEFLSIIIIIFVLVLIIGCIIIYIKISGSKSSISKIRVSNDQSVVGSIDTPGTESISKPIISVINAIITPAPSQITKPITIIPVINQITTPAPVIKPLPIQTTATIPVVKPVTTSTSVIKPVPIQVPVIIIPPAPVIKPVYIPTIETTPVLKQVTTPSPVIKPVPIPVPVIINPPTPVIGSIPIGYYLQRGDDDKYNLYNTGVLIKPGLGPGCINDLTGPFSYRSNAGSIERGTVSCSSGVNGELSTYTCLDDNQNPILDCCGEYKQSDTGETRRLLTASQAKNTNRTKTVVNTSGKMLSCDEPAPAVVVEVQQDYICKSDRKCYGVPRGEGGFIANSFQPLIGDNGGLGTEGVYTGVSVDDPCGGICDLTQTSMSTYYATRGQGAKYQGGIPTDPIFYKPWLLAGEVNVCSLINNNSGVANPNAPGCNNVMGPVLSKLGNDGGNKLISTDCINGQTCNYQGDPIQPPFICNMVGLSGVEGTEITVYGVPLDYHNWDDKNWCSGVRDEGLIVSNQIGKSSNNPYGFNNTAMGCSIKAGLTSKNPDACLFTAAEIEATAKEDISDIVNIFSGKNSWF
jgi:hypothetical protein